MTDDEHPNERLVTPSEGGEGFERSLVSRRQMLGGSALLAGLLAYTSDPTQPTNPNVGVARAADNPDEPLIILGPESDPVGYLFQDTAGGIILQDATSGNHFWYNQSQGRWETDAELDVPTLTTDDLVDGAGISHTAELADLGETFLATYDKTVGGGSITDNNGVVEVREPGNASATSTSRLYSHIFEFDPSVSRRIRVNIQNITIDDNALARIYVAVSDNIDADFESGDDVLLARLTGDGAVTAYTKEDGTNGLSSDTSQNNAFVSSLDYIEIRWDGSTLTVEASDGSTTVTVSDSSNYPSGETLQFKVEASDLDGSNARNVDFDIDSVVFDR